MGIRLEEAGRFFREAWRRCEENGWCDGEGGAEYLRVFGEWNNAQRPYNVWEFIRARANIASGEVSEEEEQQ